MYRLGHQLIFVAIGIAGAALAVVLEGRNDDARATWGWWTARVVRRACSCGAGGRRGICCASDDRSTEPSTRCAACTASTRRSSTARTRAATRPRRATSTSPAWPTLPRPRATRGSGTASTSTRSCIRPRSNPSVELLKLVGGQIVLDERGVARRLLERVVELERRGPSPLSEPDARLRRVWAQKMLARTRRGDAEGNHRRQQLLVNLLEDYFVLRGMWYRGAKVALAELPSRARATFERALAPNATHDELARLVELVIA